MISEIIKMTEYTTINGDPMEVRKYYKNRNGEKSFLVGVNPFDVCFPLIFISLGGQQWATTEDGYYNKGEIMFSESDLDIISLWQEEPDADGWIKWEGGKSPVDGDTLVDVKFRDGSVADNKRGFYWRHINVGSDIVAYRLSKKRHELEDGVGWRNWAYSAVNDIVAMGTMTFKTKEDALNFKGQFGGGFKRIAITKADATGCYEGEGLD